MATQILANVDEEWMKKRRGVLLDLEGERAHQILSTWHPVFSLYVHFNPAQCASIFRVAPHLTTHARVGSRSELLKKRMYSSIHKVVLTWQHTLEIPSTW